MSKDHEITTFFRIAGASTRLRCCMSNEIYWGFLQDAKVTDLYSYRDELYLTSKNFGQGCLKELRGILERNREEVFKKASLKDKCDTSFGLLDMTLSIIFAMPCLCVASRECQSVIATTCNRCKKLKELESKS